MEIIADQMSAEDIDSINEALSQKLADAGIDRDTPMGQKGHSCSH